MERKLAPALIGVYLAVGLAAAFYVTPSSAESAFYVEMQNSARYETADQTDPKTLIFLALRLPAILSAKLDVNGQIFSMRAFGLLLGAATLWLAYQSSLKLWPDYPVSWVLVPGLLAVSPGFTDKPMEVGAPIFIVFLFTFFLYGLIDLITAASIQAFVTPAIFLLIYWRIDYALTINVILPLFLFAAWSFFYRYYRDRSEVFPTAKYIVVGLLGMFVYLNLLEISPSVFAWQFLYYIRAFLGANNIERIALKIADYSFATGAATGLWSTIKLGAGLAVILAAAAGGLLMIFERSLPNVRLAGLTPAKPESQPRLPEFFGLSLLFFAVALSFFAESKLSFGGVLGPYIMPLLSLPVLGLIFGGLNYLRLRGYRPVFNLAVTILAVGSLVFRF